MTDKKPIKTLELWSKRKHTELGPISILTDKTVEWACQTSYQTMGDWYSRFTDIKGKKHNWLLKLWSKLNS